MAERLLSAREAAFAGHYARGANAKDAAIKIGVKPASAKQVGHRMMKRQRVLDEIARVKARQTVRLKRIIETAMRTGRVPPDATLAETASIERALTDPSVVRAAAIAVGMLPRRVIIYHRGDDKTE